VKGAAAAGALGACAPGSLTARPLDPALLRDRIKTVVVLMMENRSFDHVFGALSLVEGRTDIDGLTAAMGNPLLDGSFLPVQPASESCVGDPHHGWNSSHAQFNDGKNDGFVTEHEADYGVEEAKNVVGYLDRSWQPASYALADQFAICQRWFCSVMGPTWPNRYYSQWATSNGNRGNTFIANESLPTIYQRLDDARVPWSSYYGNLPFSSIFPNHSIQADEYAKLDQFFEDAAAGKLRSLVWLDPLYGTNDDHPPAHPLAGQVLIASLYEALRQSPQWNESLFIITYDEHGGFYDHVPPPKGVDDGAELGFDQRGFRVPSLVIGPYVNAQVSNTVFDHTSIIASVLRMHELEPLNSRDADANDLFALLDADRLARQEPRAGVKLPTFEADPDELYAEGCGGNGILHRRPGSLGVETGQPELDAAFVEKYGANHPKDLRRESARTISLLMERARALGVIDR
jgi:phospholipase C